MEPIYLLSIVSIDTYLLIAKSLVSPDRLAYCAYQNHPEIDFSFVISSLKKKKKGH